MAVPDNKLTQGVQDALRTRLPDGWRATLYREATAKDAGLDTRLELSGPDGRTACLAVEARRTLEPRGVLDLRRRLESLPTEAPLIVVAAYLSPAVRERLTALGMGFVDLTGNISISLASPGLFIDTHGADVNPDRQTRASRSIRGGKAGRIVRTLIDQKSPPGVRELAEITGVNPGYVSRILALLDQEALIERSRGRIVSVDWPRLLERWAQDVPLSSRGTQTMCLDPRGLAALTSRLRKATLHYAVTGTLAVAEFAPVTATHLAVVYVDNAAQAMGALELRIAERGANVLLIEPEDSGVFAGSTMRNGLHVVAVSQAAADLLTSPGRGPAEAEALIAWMRENEEAWRG